MSELYKVDGSAINLQFFTPESYGAVGDGIVNDTVAMQTAINNKFVNCTSGKTYRITSALRIKAGTYINLNGSTIVCDGAHLLYNFDDGDSYSGYNGNGNITICNGVITGGCISFIHGENISLKNVHFKNALNDHFLEICACKNYTIDGCSFVGMAYRENAALEYINIDTNASYPAFPHNKAGQNDGVFYDMATNKDIVIRNCYFAIGFGDFAYGFNAVGAHARNISGTYTEDITIENNIIRGFSLCGIRVNGMRNAYISNNDIRVSDDGIRVGDVADCQDVVIKNNYIDVDSGTEISLTEGQYTDLTVAYNVHSGMNDLS